MAQSCISHLLVALAKLAASNEVTVELLSLCMFMNYMPSLGGAGMSSFNYGTKDKNNLG